MKLVPFFALLILPVCSWAKTSQLATSRKEISSVLANPVFRKYSEYFIANIRSGAGMGEAATYFVVLEKPFAKPAEKACLMFQSHRKNRWELVGKEGDCKD